MKRITLFLAFFFCLLAGTQAQVKDVELSHDTLTIKDLSKIHFVKVGDVVYQIKTSTTLEVTKPILSTYPGTVFYGNGSGNYTVPAIGSLRYTPDTLTIKPFIHN